MPFEPKVLDSGPFFFSGEGVRNIHSSCAELLGDSEKLLSTKALELSCLFLLMMGGSGSGCVGGEPGILVKVVKVRVILCFCVAFNRCEVDLKILVN